MKALILAVGLAGCGKSGDRTLRVAAASDLRAAFEDIGKAFEAKTQIKPQFDFAASGLLAKQIEQGAPYSLYAAANKDFVDQVVKAGVCDGGTAQLYARGHLVLWTADAGIKSIAELADPRFKKISIANPDHAPYGKAAKQALEKAGLWAQLEGKIVLAENVQAAMQYAKRRDTDAALTALSLAIESGGKYVEIDPATYAPLDQTLVVCGQGEMTGAAKQLADFILSAEGHSIMRRYGFLLPGEAI